LAHEAKFESEELKVKEDEHTRLLQLAQEQVDMPHRTCTPTSLDMGNGLPERRHRGVKMAVHICGFSF
jgi:hypothetical protein